MKHQSKLEFGMGNSVSFPIDVKNQEVNLQYNAQVKESQWMELQGLQAWEPVQSYPQVNLHLELNGEG